MEVIILKDAQDVAKRAARVVCETVHRKPETVLGLATGSTPVAMYKELIAANQAGSVSFKKMRTFNLDEYVGLDPTHHQSYRTFMNENLFNHIDIEMDNTQVPPGNLKNPMEAGPYYERMIADAGGIDLQILGIGSNGHIGFNEPTSSFASRTRVKTLTETTVKDNSRFFKTDEFQPTLSITMGIKTILETKRVVLLATGENKAQAVYDAIEGPMACVCPASALQMHEHVTFIVDEAAASQLKMKEYYDYVLGFQDSLTEQFGDPRGV
jgi:glucosamine-6-phosphate deaminase